MQTYKDIYSKYPELATRLLRTSSTLNEISEIGSCNLDLSIKEMKKILDINKFSKKAIFDLYKIGEGEGLGLFFQVICFHKMPTEENIFNLWLYDAGASIKEEHGDYHMLTMETKNLEITLEDLEVDIERMTNIDIKILDVRSLYRLYGLRTSCLKYSNYAKIKTLEIFDTMINKLNTYDTIVILNLYLMVNCLILDIDISDKFIKSQMDFYLDGEVKYDYEDYLNHTEEERNNMIDNIKQTINQAI